MKKISCIYWAATDMAFVEILRQQAAQGQVDFRFQRFSHHEAWFGPRKSLFKNLLHIFRQIFLSLKLQPGSDVVLFGTNLCRIFFPLFLFKRRVIYIYNEMPAEKQSSKCLYFYDRLIFRSRQDVYVSSTERSTFCMREMGLDRAPGVLLNMPLLSWKQDCREKEVSTLRYLYAGTVTKKRFAPEIVKILTLQQVPVDVYGLAIGISQADFPPIFQVRGEISHAEMLHRMGQYRFALLSYYRDEVNYELCAPIKIFEYVAAGCHVVSVNRNNGLAAIFKAYPALFSFLDEFDPARMAPDAEYEAQRQDFLTMAKKNNVEFVDFLRNGQSMRNAGISLGTSTVK
jgi:hypothetical protein